LSLLHTLSLHDALPICAGPETVSLNRLEGLTLEEAEKYIDDHDLTLSSKEVYSDSVDEGEIVKQEPEANEEVTAGTEVKVEVSRSEEHTSELQSRFDIV